MDPRRTGGGLVSGLILVIDDDPQACGMLGKALGESGFAVLAAPDGEAGLRAATEAGPDLILMDAVMPGISGFEACRMLKTQAGVAHIPVMFMTGLSESEHVVEGFRAGGVDYVTKPVVLDELIARIRVHLGNAQMAMSARWALDITGRSLLATDPNGAIRWRTPQAERLLGALGDGQTHKELADALQTMSMEPPAAGATAQSIRLGGLRLLLSYLGRTGEDCFFRLQEPLEGREAGILREALKITVREADVLLWISRGKSNRDISEILNISARTVNKHLEQVFTKLGVENRAAAASIATRVVAAYG
jgi:DNA-binding NarL/FixJ family response regulator